MRSPWGKAEQDWFGFANARTDLPCYAPAMTIEDLPMTDAQIARAYPHLSEPMARVALLGEALEMTRDLAAARLEFAEAAKSKAVVDEIISRRGTLAEIENAEEVARRYILDVLTKLSEQELEEGREKGLLSSEDQREALKAIRTMSLQRGRTDGRDKDRERE
ncbi:hypothetical protein [Rhodospirillum sp. A1_3_36]|uniref:hypothetical protein n=1 Tax=Rhodospirillum sp. A1_3_36 TaxID=3391666 RepID=UPI0039A4259C